MTKRLIQAHVFSSYLFLFTPFFFFQRGIRHMETFSQDEKNTSFWNHLTLCANCYKSFPLQFPPHLCTNFFLILFTRLSLRLTIKYMVVLPFPFEKEIHHMTLFERESLRTSGLFWLVHYEIFSRYHQWEGGSWEGFSFYFMEREKESSTTNRSKSQLLTALISYYWAIKWN